jgi:hypothetical protein
MTASTHRAGHLPGRVWETMRPERSGSEPPPECGGGGRSSPTLTVRARSTPVQGCRGKSPAIHPVGDDTARHPYVTLCGTAPADQIRPRRRATVTAAVRDWTPSRR